MLANWSMNSPRCFAEQPGGQSVDSAQADHEIADAITGGDLREGDAQELVQTAERANAAVAIVAPDAAMQRLEWQVPGVLRVSGTNM